MEQSIELNVNGRSRTVLVPPSMPLLWVLRDVLGLTGTRFGCGVGLCGACTVHLDGEAVRSCSVPAAQAAGTAVVTIEGLPASHPVKQAWISQSVPQCGYCQAGQIMQAAALLSRLPSPDRPAVERALTGNVCRCGTYDRIRRAVVRAGEAS